MKYEQSFSERLYSQEETSKIIRNVILPNEYTCMADLNLWNFSQIPK